MAELQSPPVWLWARTLPLQPESRGWESEPALYETCLTFYFLLFIIIFLLLFFKDFIYLFIRDTERERGRDTGRENRLNIGSLMWDSIPGTPGSHPGPKAGAKPLSHPGIPHFIIS